MDTHAVGNSSRRKAGLRLRHALLTSTMLALACVSPAAAQSDVPGQAAAQPVSVPAGPLTPALNSLAAQVGLQILFDAGLTEGKTTSGVSGTMTPNAALDGVLAGTGVSARFAGRNLVSLDADTAAVIDAEGTTLLDTITIYGARDATTLNDTSSSVGIATAEDIENSQIGTVRDSFRRMANVMDADWVNGGFIIRGVNSEGFASGSALIGSIYVDGVLQTPDGARRGASGLWDVEQVEVYRGPQSTLSGRAAMAGAIYVKTKDPTFEKEASLSGTVGTDDRFGTSFMVNTPLVTDQVAMRISGSFDRSKSEINYPSYMNFEKYDDWTTDLYYNVRGKVLFEPAAMPLTRALLSYSFSHDAPTDRDIGGPGIGWDFDDLRGDFNSPDYTEPRSTRVHNVGLEVTHELTDALSLTSLTGVSHSYTDRSSINYGTAGEEFYLVGDRSDLLLSQEVRLNYDQDQWSAVGGIFTSYDSYDNYTDRFRSGPRNDYRRTQQEGANAAAFGEASYEFIPTWKVTVGGRIDYTHQTLEDFGTQARPTGSTPVVTADYEATLEETNFVPKIGISKDFGENQTVGLIYSEGFRTGGSGFDPLEDAPYSYDPEKSSNYEAFYKGSFLDGRLTLNANVFYTEFSDQQVEVITDLTNYYTRTVNAASSRSYGLEFEPTFKVNDNFSAFASIGYLNTKFEEFSTPYVGDLSGLAFPEAPKWSAALGGTYTFDNGIYLGGDVKYVSDSMSRLSFSPPNDFLDERTLVNLQAGYRSEKWEMNVFAENVLDEEYFTYYDNDAYATIGASRSVGLTIKTKF